MGRAGASIRQLRLVDLRHQERGGVKLRHPSTSTYAGPLPPLLGEEKEGCVCSASSRPSPSVSAPQLPDAAEVTAASAASGCMMVVPV